MPRKKFPKEPGESVPAAILAAQQCSPRACAVRSEAKLYARFRISRHGARCSSRVQKPRELPALPGPSLLSSAGKQTQREPACLLRIGRRPCRKAPESARHRPQTIDRLEAYDPEVPALLPSRLRRNRRAARPAPPVSAVAGSGVASCRHGYQPSVSYLPIDACSTPWSLRQIEVTSSTKLNDVVPVNRRAGIRTVI